MNVIGNNPALTKAQETKTQIAQMTNTSNSTSSLFKIPLASIQWLKYLGIVSAVLSLYIVVLFYYRYGDDIFSKSLTIGQHIKLSVYSIGSMLSELILPLLFFSGALLYRSVRLNGISPLIALKRDLIIFLPLAIMIWVYGAFVEEPVERRFYAMIWDVQTLEKGEKLVQDSKTYDLMEGPNLSGLQEKIDTLTIQIKDFENQFLKNGSPAMKSYIEELQKQQRKYQDEVMVIHFKPLYVLLFLILGLLLGYLIPLHKAALTAILIAIGFAWYYAMSVLESSLSYGYSSMHMYLLGKIGFLLVINTVLLILAIKAFKRSKENTYNSR